ncbi:hypothetical protein MALU111345_10135 [Marinicrinis lubricantis]
MADEAAREAKWDDIYKKWFYLSLKIHIRYESYSVHAVSEASQRWSG